MWLCVCPQLRSVDQESFHDEGGVRVTAFPVPHDEVSYGFKIEHRGRSVVISGDTGFFEEIIRQAQGVDVLIHEVFYVDPDGGMAPDPLARLRTIHTVPEAAARVFSAARPRVAVATHLGGPGMPRLEAEVRAEYDGRLVVGEDLMTLVIADSIRVVRR